MKKTLFKVDTNLCAECSLALRRFVGGLNGIASVEVEQGKIAVTFDDATIDEDKVKKIAKDSIERLGYRLDE